MLSGGSKENIGKKKVKWNIFLKISEETIKEQNNFTVQNELRSQQHIFHSLDSRQHSSRRKSCSKKISESCPFSLVYRVFQEFAQHSAIGIIHFHTYVSVSRGKKCQLSEIFANLLNERSHSSHLRKLSKNKVRYHTFYFHIQPNHKENHYKQPRTSEHCFC